MCDVMQQPPTVEMRGDESLDPQDLPSLDFIEDSYLPRLDSIVTPSLDEIQEEGSHGSGAGDFRLGATVSSDGDYYTYDWTAEEAEQYLRSLTLDQILDVPNETIPSSISADELQMVETEFTPLKLAASDKLKAKLIRLFTRRSLRDVRVTFIDFSKPYLARVSSGDNYKKFLHINHTNAGELWSCVLLIHDLVGCIGWHRFVWRKRKETNICQYRMSSDCLAPNTGHYHGPGGYEIWFG